jgi:hypothetical protein
MGKKPRSIHNEPRSIHNDDIRRFAAGGQPEIATPSIAYGRALAGGGAVAVIIVLILLAIPAWQSAATAPPPPAALFVATALIIPTLAPTLAPTTVAPTTVASSSRQIGPDGLAAGWTPAARDLPLAGGAWYLVLDDAPVGGSCRIGVLTPHPGTAADVAQVWTDCTEQTTRR